MLGVDVVLEGRENEVLSLGGLNAARVASSVESGALATNKSQYQGGGMMVAYMAYS